MARRTAAAFLALLLVVGSVATSHRLYQSADLRTGPYDYNVADWGLRHFPGKWLFLFGELFRDGATLEEQDQALARFFDLTRQIDELRGRLNDAERRGTPAGEAEVLRLQSLLHERAALEARVEATIASRVSAVAREAGLTRTPVSLVWPPVDFKFTDSPRTLAVSRRDRIELVETRLLRAGFSLEKVERIEAEWEASGELSALSFPTGGVGVYPAIVAYTTDYFRALETVAHEWMHHYLFFYPLGFNYYASADLRTINETVADLVGKELAEAAIARWPLAGQSAGRARTPAAAPAEAAFDIGAALRALREEVDVLLDEGRVQEAEALMEQRRREFAAQGHAFRRLNQAYFAFVNLYAGEAGSPAATSPIGPMVDELRRRSASLQDFVSLVRDVTSLADLEALLAAGGH